MKVCNPICQGSPFITKAVYPKVRERQLELAEASSMAVISRLASAPLPWVQWLSGKSIRLVIGRPRFDSQLDICGFIFPFLQRF